MADFYRTATNLGRYEDMNTPKNRALRQDLLNMLQQFHQEQVSGERSDVKAALDMFSYKVAEELEDGISQSTEFFPQTMSTTFKYNKFERDLSFAEYIEYQQIFETNYYAYVAPILAATGSTEAKLKALNKAKRTAKQVTDAQIYADHPEWH